MKNLKDAMVVVAFLALGAIGNVIGEIPGIATEVNLLAAAVSIIGYGAGGYYLACSNLLREVTKGK